MYTYQDILFHLFMNLTIDVISVCSPLFEKLVNSVYKKLKEQKKKILITNTHEVVFEYQC